MKLEKSLVIISILALIGAVSAAPFTQPEVLTDYPIDIVSGNKYDTFYSFENSADQELPLVVRIIASSETGVEGPEFRFDSVVNSTNGNETKATVMTCKQIEDRRVVEQQTDKKAFYSCYSTGKEILPLSENNISLETVTDLRMQPGNYSLDLKTYSRIGKVSGRQQAQINSSTEFDLGESKVRIDAERDSQVAVWKIDESLIEGPADVFLGGLDVQISEIENCSLSINDSSQPDNIDELNYNRFDSLECDLPKSNASGNIQIGYDDAGINENTVSIYYFNPETLEWEEIQNQQLDQNSNTVSADVDHFSVYTVYGDQSSNTGSSGNSGGGGNGAINVSFGESSNGEDSVIDDNQTGTDETPTEPSTNTTEPDESNNQTEQPDDGNVDSPTGEFFTGTSGGIIGLLFLIMVVLAYYYRVRIMEYFRDIVDRGT